MRDDLDAAASALDTLSPTDRGYIDEILGATARDVALFEDWEFSTLFGVERDRFRVLTAEWHEVLQDRYGERGLRVETLAVVANALANALGYPGAAERLPRADHAERLLSLLTPRPMGAE